MELGYELLRDQVFFRKELKERVFWFIRLRWLAAASSMAVGWAAYLFGVDLAIVPLSIVSFCVFFYNLIFLWLGKRLDSLRSGAFEPFAVFAHAQISLDLLALFVLIYFTGGASSPILFFTIFHLIIAGILLSPLSCYVYGAAIIAASGSLAAVRLMDLLPFQGMLYQEQGIKSAPAESFTIIIYFLAFSCAVAAASFLVTSIKKSLQVKGRELMHLSTALNASNAKLTALYEMVKEMSLKRDLQALMDTATRYAAMVMSVKGCSIKLLDESKKQLRFASTFGLSADYLSTGAIDIERSIINRKILDGSLYVIGRIDEKDYFQYPEKILEEGIASMLCLPLRVGKMVYGILCVYCSEKDCFEEDDIEFFALVTDLTALAIESMKMEETKTWFFLKAAHELKSPLNAVASMLKMLRGNYLGELQFRQQETIERCEKRLESSSYLIADLLKLGQQRVNADRKEFKPTDIKPVFQSVFKLYQESARDKGLQFEVSVGDRLPLVLADDRILDELVANLLSNAIKYTPNGGRISISIRKVEEKWLEFRISDTGIGISKEDLSRLFTEFFRGRNACDQVEEGTGLGLVIVKELLDKIGGTIRVESELGNGSSFTCRLPLAPVETPAGRRHRV